MLIPIFIKKWKMWTILYILLCCNQLFGYNSNYALNLWEVYKIKIILKQESIK